MCVRRSHPFLDNCDKRDNIGMHNRKWKIPWNVWTFVVLVLTVTRVTILLCFKKTPLWFSTTGFWHRAACTVLLCLVLSERHEFCKICQINLSVHIAVVATTSLINIKMLLQRTSLICYLHYLTGTRKQDTDPWNVFFFSGPSVVEVHYEDAGIFLDPSDCSWHGI